MILQYRCKAIFALSIGSALQERIAAREPFCKLHFSKFAAKRIAGNVVESKPEAKRPVDHTHLVVSQQLNRIVIVDDGTISELHPS